LVAAPSGSEQLGAHAENGGTPLHYAAAEGNPDAVLSLLQARADPCAVDFKGRTFDDVAHPDVKDVLVPRVSASGSVVFDAGVVEVANLDDENDDNKAFKLLELGQNRASAGDYAAATRAFFLVLRLCNDKSTWGEDLIEKEAEDYSEPSADPDRRSIPGAMNTVTAPKSDDEKARDAYETLEPKQDCDFSECACQCLQGLAQCHHHRAEFSACGAACTAALQLDPDCVEALRLRGVSSLERGQAESAAQDLHRAAVLAPTDIAIRQQLSQAQEKVKEVRAKEAAVARRMLEISGEGSADNLSGTCTPRTNRNSSGYSLRSPLNYKRPQGSATVNDLLSQADALAEKHGMHPSKPTYADSFEVLDKTWEQLD